MSLINDALKRATKASPSAKVAGAAGEPMRPADSHQSVALPRYFFPILLCIFCGAMWFLARGWDSRRQAAAQPAAVSVQAREARADAVVVVEPGVAPVRDDATEGLVTPAAANPPNPKDRNFALADEAESTAPAAGALVAPTPQALRLQGIFYRTSGPSAVVNGQTVFVGDVVSGSRVKAISRSSVTLERDGQTQLLTLR